MLIDIAALFLIGIGAVRGAVEGIARTTIDLLLLLAGIPVAFRLGGWLGDLAFSSLAPLFGRTLGSVILLAVLGATVNRIAVRRFAKSQDQIDQIGGALIGLARGWVFAAMTAIILSGLAGSFGASGIAAGSVLAESVTDDESWTLAAFEAASGDDQLIRTVAFNRQFPDGPVLADGFRALPATPLSELAHDPQAGVEITVLVNEARAAAGLGQLVWSSALSEVATAYATEMATEGFFGHDSPRTGDVGDRLRAAGVGYSAAGENLALGPTVERIHDGLMNSPGHRANILNAGYRQIGVGVVRGPLGLMTVQVFRR